MIFWKQDQKLEMYIYTYNQHLYFNCFISIIIYWKPWGHIDIHNSKFTLKCAFSVFTFSIFVTPFFHRKKYVSCYLQYNYWLSCLFVINLHTLVGHCYRPSVLCGLYLPLNYFHSTQLLCYNNLSNYCCDIKLLLS